MSYVELATKDSTDTFCSSDWNDVAGNMNMSVPNMFEAKGDIAVASGVQAIDNLSVGNDGDVLQCSTDATLLLEWTGTMGVGLTTDSITLADSTATAIPFYTELYDTDNAHDVSPSTDAIYITVPCDGLYLIYGGAEFESNATGYRAMYLYVTYNGGAPVYHGETSNAVDAIMGLDACYIHPLKAGDIVYMVLVQSSGGDLIASHVKLNVHRLR